jgi:hypothetical protein
MWCIKINELIGKIVGVARDSLNNVKGKYK